MSRIIVFANQKGGVGKTTSTINVGAYLADMGRSVLLVDFDPQCNLSSGVGVDISKPGIYQLITFQNKVQECIQKTSVKNLKVIPASPDLAGATIELVEQEDREYYLKKGLALVENTENYDFILIDCPPSLGILTLNGLTAAKEVIIPLQTEYFALEGIAQFLKNISMIQKTSNSELTITGILFTMYDVRTRLAQDVVKEVVGYFGKLVFQAIIPRNIRLSEAPSYSVPINQYDANCAGAKSYLNLAMEVIKRG